MAFLPVRNYGAKGDLIGTLTAASAGGDSFANDGRTMFFVTNAGPNTTLTFLAPHESNQGVARNLVVGVPAGAILLGIGFFNTDRFNAAGIVSVGYSGVTGLSVAPVRIGNCNGIASVA